MIQSKTSTILAPAEFVYDWHTQNGTFERLTPPWETVQPIEVLGDFNDRYMHLKMKQFGINIHWHAHHKNVIKHSEFTDIQEKGPFKSWEHRHQFIPLSDTRSKLIDTIQYKLPLHTITQLMSKWHVNKSIQNLLAYRHAISQWDLAMLYNNPVKKQTIAISGASGMIGKALSIFLKTAGHTVKHLVRKSKPDWSHEICWDPELGITGDYSQIDIIIHLAGESIASPVRWTQLKKNKIRRSRVRSTQAIVTQLLETPQRVHTFICASAIGIYPNSNTYATETSPPGNNFLARVVTDWEAACDPIRNKLRVLNLRLGTVLHPTGGMIKKCQPMMNLGLLGKIGSGNQYVSWVSLDDAIRAIYFLMANKTISGPVNLVAPQAQKQYDWLKEWGRYVKRPTISPLPETMVKRIFGEMGDALLLPSQRVTPAVLNQHGFKFQCKNMADVCELYQL